MRPTSSYRANRKQRARAQGISLKDYNAGLDRSIRAAEANDAETRAARERLGIWARNGGRETAVSPPAPPTVLAAMNAATITQDGLKKVEQALLTPAERELTGTAINAMSQADIARKITVEDIDKAMEKLLSKWQADGNVDPLPLSPLFAARARQIGWVEGVEFAEDRSG